MPYPPLVLNKGEERRLRGGHQWVFSNEVDVRKTPLDGFSPGQIVQLVGSKDQALGVAYVNPRSLICARRLSRDPGATIDQAFIAARIKKALEFRERIFDRPYYRLVYGESDGLPGLVVDRYGDFIVAQINTAGMAVLKEPVIAAIQEVVNPQGLLFRNDSPARKLEGLPEEVELAFGEIPEQVTVEENGLAFSVPLHSGQKTGWYFDHRDNRARLRRYVRGRRVLDVFSYLGGWGMNAAAGGATELSCVDLAESAAEAIAGNAERNGLGGKLRVLTGDAFDQLKTLNNAEERFGVIVLDPPAFIKRKKDILPGIEAYHRLNLAAMHLLEPEGILVSSSCSYHLPEEQLRDILRRCALQTGRRLQILERGMQAPDHPVHPAIPETQYLKCFYCRVI